VIPGSVKFRPASPPRHSCANILCLYCLFESVTIVTFTDLNCLKYEQTVFSRHLVVYDITISISVVDA